MRAFQPTPALITAAGQALAQLRIEAGLSPEQLALNAQVSASTVTRFEKGLHLPRPSNYKRLSTALADALHDPNRVAQMLGTAWKAAHGLGTPSTSTPNEVPEKSVQTPTVVTVTGPTYSTVQHTNHIYSPPPALEPTRVRAPRPPLPTFLTVALIGLLAACSLLSAMPGVGLAAQRMLSPSTNSRACDHSKPTFDEWLPVSVPYGPPADAFSAIAMRNVDTGQQETILTPDASRHYVSYLSPVWSATACQLYFIAVGTDGRHEIWSTPFTDNGQSVSPQPRSGWPRNLLPDRGPNCTSLGWTRDGNGLTYVGATGHLMAYNVVTGQVDPV